MQQKEEIKGIGGWLALPVIGLILGGVRIVGVLGKTYLPLFQKGDFMKLLDQASAAYYPNLAYALLFETVYKFFIVIFMLILFIRVINYKKNVPMLFITFFSLQFVFTLLDELFVYFSPRLSELIYKQDVETIMKFTGSLSTLLVLIIWGLYFLKSQRVKNTFVK